MNNLLIVELFTSFWNNCLKIDDEEGRVIITSLEQYWENSPDVCDLVSLVSF